MFTNLFTLIKTLRPRQWLKNLAVFASIIFTGQLFEPQIFRISVWAFMVFCLVSSSNYLINDVVDAPKDRKHPFKRFRAIASGAVSPNFAVILALVMLIIGFLISLTINTSFFVVVGLYFLMSVFYTFLLKHIAVVDILVIASGYFLRVYAGEAATGWHLSIWLSLAIFSLSLFLAIGKRRSELTLIQNYSGAKPIETRSTLGHYSEKLLDAYVAMFAVSTFITYSYYTFLERPPSSNWAYRRFISESIPTDRKWLMATIPFVLYGIMRYMQLIYEGKGESPEKILTSDKPLLGTILAWSLTAILIIYLIGG